MKDLKIGDMIIVGSYKTTYEEGNRIDKFLPIAFGAKVSKISVDEYGRTKFDLNWINQLGTSFVFKHNHGKHWLKVEEYN